MEKINADEYSIVLTKIKKDNLEELFLITKFSIENLIYYIKYKQTKIDIPSRCVKIVKEFIKIINEERKIINFLLDNITYIEESNLDKYLIKLDILNTQTINYFYQYLDDMEDAIELNDIGRINYKRQFKTLPENKDIKYCACNLIFSKELLKKYLGYEEEFWDFIDSKTTFTDKIEKYELKWEYNKNQVNINLILPRIKDLNTALICCKAYNKAHVLYINNYKTRTDFPEEKIKKYHKDNCKYFNIK